MKQETIDILVQNLSLKEYMKVTKDVSDLETEILKRNNFIRELEEWLNKKIEVRCDDCNCLSEVLDRIEELKKENIIHVPNISDGE